MEFDVKDVKSWYNRHDVKKGEWQPFGVEVKEND